MKITKGILASLLMIGVIAMAVGTGTFAYFSDTETSTGNTFTAGTIDIDVDGQNPWTSSYKVTVGDDEELKPCQVGWINYTIHNCGTNPVDVWKMISNIVYNTGDTSEVYYWCPSPCKFRVSSEPECTAMGASCQDFNEIGDFIWFDLVVDGEVLISEDEKLVIDCDGTQGGQASGIKGCIEAKEIYLGRLEPCQNMTVNQSFHLYSSTPNIYQGDEMEFTETLTAYQCEGYTPKPTPT